MIFVLFLVPSIALALAIAITLAVVLAIYRAIAPILYTGCSLLSLGFSVLFWVALGSSGIFLKLTGLFWALAISLALALAIDPGFHVCFLGFPLLFCDVLGFSLLSLAFLGFSVL